MVGRNRKVLFLWGVGIFWLCWGGGQGVYGQEKVASQLHVGISLSSSIIRLSEPAYVIAHMQSYSPGVFVRYKNHLIYGNWDFYSRFLFEMQSSRAPVGFQVGYRYHIPDVLPFAELYGEFNYAYLSYVNWFEHIRYTDFYTSGSVHYVYMGNLALGAHIPIWDRFSVNGSVGYGTSYVDVYILSNNWDTHDWRYHVYFRLELNARIWRK